MTKPSIVFSILRTCLFTCLLTSCSSTLMQHRQEYLHAYHQGNLNAAENQLNHLVAQEIPQKDYTASKDASWLLLDCATTHFAMGKIDEAIQDYQKAIEALDYYAQDLTAEEAGKLLLEDRLGAYQADDFEQVLARVYFALALLHQGDESNAYALLRQAEEYQQYRREVYRQIPFTQHYHMADNGLSKYLFAALLERRGDLTNANILYKQAFELIPKQDYSSLQSSRTGKEATVLVICHNGKAPYKVSGTSPASAASMAALEMLLATKHIAPCVSGLTGIPIPILKNWSYASPLPTYAKLDGTCKALLPLYSVANAAQAELQQKLPVIVARGAARLLMRRYAVGYLQEKDQNLGMLADATMYLINSQTQADIRSWTTLPAFIDLARFDMTSGCHKLQIQVYDSNGCPSIQEYGLTLNPRDLCIIHVFNLHPGVNYVLIPDRYLVTQGDFL